jgi:hypothetical protein
MTFIKRNRARQAHIKPVGTRKERTFLDNQDSKEICYLGEVKEGDKFYLNLLYMDFMATATLNTKDDTKYTGLLYVPAQESMCFEMLFELAQEAHEKYETPQPTADNSRQSVFFFEHNSELLVRNFQEKHSIGFAEARESTQDNALWVGVFNVDELTVCENTFDETLYSIYNDVLTHNSRIRCTARLGHHYKYHWAHSRYRALI